MRHTRLLDGELLPGCKRGGPCVRVRAEGSARCGRFNESSRGPLALLETLLRCPCLDVCKKPRNVTSTSGWPKQAET